MSMAHTQKVAGFRESAIKLGIAKSVSVVSRCASYRSTASASVGPDVTCHRQTGQPVGCQVEGMTNWNDHYS